MVKKCALIAALLLVLGPASARADWLFIPNIGVGFGGDLPQNDKLTYGASIGAPIGVVNGPCASAADTAVQAPQFPPTLAIGFERDASVQRKRLS